MGIYIKDLAMPTSCNKCPFTCEALQFFNGTDIPQSCPLIEIVRCGECKYQYMCGHQIKRNGLTLKLTCCEYGERRADEHIDWDAFNSKLEIQYAEGRGKTLAPTILEAEP